MPSATPTDGLVRTSTVVTFTALPAFAAGFGIALLVDDDTPPPRVAADEVQRTVWEAFPGAGAPPDCRSARRSGVGPWTCEVFYRGAARPPERVTIRVSESGKITRVPGGSELACCVPVRGG